MPQNGDPRPACSDFDHFQTWWKPAIMLVKQNIKVEVAQSARSHVTWRSNRSNVAIQHDKQAMPITLAASADVTEADQGHMSSGNNVHFLQWTLFCWKQLGVCSYFWFLNCNDMTVTQSHVLLLLSLCPWTWTLAFHPLSFNGRVDCCTSEFLCPMTKKTMTIARARNRLLNRNYAINLVSCLTKSFSI